MDPGPSTDGNVTSDTAPMEVVWYHDVLRLQKVRNGFVRSLMRRMKWYDRRNICRTGKPQKPKKYDVCDGCVMKRFCVWWLFCWCWTQILTTCALALAKKASCRRTVGLRLALRVWCTVTGCWCKYSNFVVPQWVIVAGEKVDVVNTQKTSQIETER